MASIEVLIPSLEEITLGQFQEYTKIEQPTELDIFRIFLGYDEDVVRKLPAHSVDLVVSTITKQLQEDVGLQTLVKINGKQFGFIPKLEDISWGEQNDCSMYFPKENNWDNMHKAMAVLYRPTTYSKRDTYIIEDYEGSSKYANTMKDIPMSVVKGAMVFFCDLMSDLLGASRNYILQANQKHPLSLEHGEAIINYIQSLEEISLGMKMQLKLNTWSVLPISPIKKQKPSTKQKD